MNLTSERVSRLLRAHQHKLGYSVPFKVTLRTTSDHVWSLIRQKIWSRVVSRSVSCKR